MSYDDVWLVPQRSPVNDLTAVETASNLTPGIELELPVVAAPMDTVTEAGMAVAMDEGGGLGVIHRFMTVDEQAEAVRSASREGARVGAAIGVAEDFVERAEQVREAGVDVLVMDIAHGHLDRCLEALREVRSELGDVPLVAGNVATRHAVEDLAAAGADTVKVGIGPGSHCTTRKVAGAGVPQMTAVMDCAEAAREHGVCSIADGGIRTSGEIVKALMAGADTVMLGGMLMGTDETPGEVVQQDGARYKRTRGMASNEARGERTDKAEEGGYAEEGVTGLTPYRGPVRTVLNDIRGGLRSGISYCGGHTVEEAREKAEFIRTSHGAKTREGMHGHGILER